MKLLHNLSYDPDTGIFEWITLPRGQNRKRAGYQDRLGYRHIRINGKLYKEHRLAWLAVKGVMPESEIDHINGNPADNRFSNLRLATSTENKWNSRVQARNRSGLKGVKFYSKINKWGAAIQVNKKRRYLGWFKTAEEAHEAYCRVAKAAFGEFFPRDRAGRLSLSKDE